MAAEVRVRFAPSPTGGLHIGGVRTALYNYLFAQNQGGKFIVRIEDTDQKRKVEGAEKYIMDALQWCGIEPDESPFHEGDFGPYRQSERLDAYKKYAQQLLDSGRAYYAFDTPEALDAMRKKLQEEKAAIQQYGITTRMNMENSLTLSEEETKHRIESGDPYVIRLKVPENKSITVQDIVRGEVTVDSNLIDDKILMKSDGYPTYHLANVVDDHLMEISHVIRGEEWLPSAPLHVLLYKLLGWGTEIPKFAHLPLLLKPEGSGKLSKRDAEKHGFPIFPILWQDPKTNESVPGFREEGYYPAALVNFIALLGWNPGSDAEVFSMNELTKVFSLKGINKSGAKFDIEKAKWYNQIYLREQPQEEIETQYVEYVESKGFSCSIEKAARIVSLMADRVTFFTDYWNLGSFFFVEPSEYDEQMARKKWNTEVAAILKLFAQGLTSDLLKNGEELKQSLWDIANDNGSGIGKVMPGLRLALVGYGGGPDIVDIMQVLGVSETKHRIQTAIEKLT